MATSTTLLSSISPAPALSPGLVIGSSEASKRSALICNACFGGKAHCTPFAGPGSRASKRLGCVFLDPLTPLVPLLLGCNYTIVSVNDCTQMLWTEPLAAKLDALHDTQDWIALGGKFSGCQVKRLHSDTGGKYLSRAFDNYLSARGIEHTTTTPYSPQQNGVAERVNRTLVEGVLSMLADSGLPPDLWAEAMRTFTHVKNLAPHHALRGDTPYRLWHGSPAPVTHLRACGCRAWATRPANAVPRRRKL